jgi:hypothetical protein
LNPGRPDPWGATFMNKNPSVWLNPEQPKENYPLTAEHEAVHALWNAFYPRSPVTLDPGMYFQYSPEIRQTLRENYPIGNFDWYTKARYNEAPTVSYDLWGRDDLSNLPDVAKRWFAPIFQDRYLNP